MAADKHEFFGNRRIDHTIFDIVFTHFTPSRRRSLRTFHGGVLTHSHTIDATFFTQYSHIVRRGAGAASPWSTILARPRGTNIVGHYVSSEGAP